MTQKIKHTLKKDERLKSRKAIEQLFASGKSFSVFPLRIVYEKKIVADGGYVKAGFSASARYFKKAVDRNRIKRLIRECWRLQKHLLAVSTHTQINVFFLFNGNELPDYKTIFEKTGNAIKRLQKIADESTENDS